MPNDMENYMQYRLMGSISQVKMKPGCMPSKFECQPDRKRKSNTAERPFILKKQKMMELQRSDKLLEESSKVSEHVDVNEIATESSGMYPSSSYVYSLSFHS